MKRIQIMISAEWPEGEKLEDHIARGNAGSSIKNLLAEVRPKIRDYAVGFDISEPEIVETRAPRADKGKRRKGQQVPNNAVGFGSLGAIPPDVARAEQARGNANLLGIAQPEASPPFPEIPESLRREKV